MAKYLEIAEVLRNQLQRGEYPTGKLPPLRKLAADMGVSYLTACRAVKALEASGDDQTRAPRPLVGMITPHWAFTEWHRAVRDATKTLGGQVRFISYGSDTDPNISEAINEESFDLIFIFLPDRDNARLMELISKARDRVVVMFRDITSYGVRCLYGADPFYIEQLLESLRQSGHTRIDALGRDMDMRESSESNSRYRIWHNWINRHGLKGNFHELQWRAFEPDDAKSAEFCREKLKRGEMADAVFCFNPTLAFGLYRACYERGIIPGKDISIFSFGDQEMAKLMTPALATVMNIGVEETIRNLVREYCPGANRSERLMFHLENTTVFEGESLIKPGKGR